MNLFKVILIHTSFLLSAVSFAGEKTLVQLTNSARPAVKMMVLEATPSGVPKKVGFSNGTKILSFANVTESDLVIDVMTGEIYNVTGPQDATAICNLNAKLSLDANKNIVIDFDQADVGIQFFQSCQELAEIAGTYRK